MPAPGSPSPCRFYLDGSALVLKGLKAQDSGAYTCVAHNAAGEDARLHTVSVLGERLRAEARRELCYPGAAAAWPVVGPPMEGDTGARMRKTWFKPRPCPHRELGHHLTSLGLCNPFWD